MKKPIVAIIGRQNVGKSTLLNRLTGRRISIVEDMPGTTRDRIFADVSWQGKEFTLIDTGGLEPEGGGVISEGVNSQIAAAITEADVIIFLVDAKDGVNPLDIDIAHKLRRINKPILLTANKVDNSKLEPDASAFYELGLGDVMHISAHHGRGTAELLDKLVEILPEMPEPEPEPEMLKLAIVGRPNVGKSMLLNSIVGEKRVVVSEIPGTTRDAVDTKLDYNGQDVLLIDSAGIRKRGKFGDGVERYSVIRSLRAIERADIALLVIDATEPLTAQDLHVGGYIQQMAKGIVLVVNKWDLVKEASKPDWNKMVRSKLKFASYSPIVFTSALSGQGVADVMPAVLTVYKERMKRISTPEVNSVIRRAIAAHNPAQSGRRPLKIFYATQAEVNPPTFVFFVNDAKLVHFSYQRFLENKLREAFGFEGTPLRFIFKARSEQNGNSR